MTEWQPGVCEGDGVESYFLPETFQKSTIAIPEDFESREEMVKQSVKTNERAKQVTSRFEANFMLCIYSFKQEEFLHTALSRLEEERDEIMRRLEEERRLHQAALQQVATTSHEHHHHSTYSETGKDPALSLGELLRFEIRIRLR